MIALLTDNKDSIEALCREYRIKKLDVFGSAATGAFNPETSDIDFVVDLGGYESGVSRRYFRFAEALEALFGHPVELITEEQIKNPYFREAVEEQRTLIYEARDSQAIA
jgi:predicted nucleotidyltransferase